MAHESGLSTCPTVVAELGPGKSLGVGCAALISGAQQYVALDVRQHATDSRNLEIFDELVELFANKEPIPDQTEFPNAKPLLKSYDFPTHILTDERLEISLDRFRINEIRESLSNPALHTNHNNHVKYIAPWYDADMISESSVDMIFSQAVLEHVDDLSNTYEMLKRWLKPSGVMSHEIDFKSHRTSSKWNGHWVYSDFVWRLIVGRRTHLLNREPHSVHIALLNRLDFKIICDIAVHSKSDIAYSQLAKKFKHITPEDLTISDAFIQATCQKP